MADGRLYAAAAAVTAPSEPLPTPDRLGWSRGGSGLLPNLRIIDLKMAAEVAGAPALTRLIRVFSVTFRRQVGVGGGRFRPGGQWGPSEDSSVIIWHKIRIEFRQMLQERTGVGSADAFSWRDRSVSEKEKASCNSIHRSDLSLSS